MVYDLGLMPYNRFKLYNNKLYVVKPEGGFWGVLFQLSSMMFIQTTLNERCEIKKFNKLGFIQ